MVKVRGSNRAMAGAGLSPGIAPTLTPTATPTTAHIMVLRAKTKSRASAMLAKSKLMGLSSDQEGQGTVLYRYIEQHQQHAQRAGRHQTKKQRSPERFEPEDHCTT